MRGQHAFVVEKVADETAAELVTGVTQQLYGDADADIPFEVLVPVMPEAAVQPWLAARAGHRVDVRVPQRGHKRSLLETVTTNAAQTCSRTNCGGPVISAPVRRRSRRSPRPWR